jgi:hypothetical protein
MDKNISPFFPGKPGSGRDIQAFFAAVPVFFRFVLISGFVQKPAVRPAYYKAYIIRRIICGETSGPAGD